ncbi:daf-12-interacting protein 1-like isoform X2 [Haliotis cracherodii]
MSRLPSIVTTDSEPTDSPQSSSGSVGSGTQPPSMSGSSPPQQGGQGARKKIPPDIRSVDSGYCETSHAQHVVSDAVPSMEPLSMETMNLQPSGGSSVDLPASTMDTVSHIRDHLVHQIQKSVGGKGKKEDSSSMTLASIPSSSSPSSCSSSSGAQDVTEEDIQKLLNEMPPDMRVDFQDAMVLYCEEDRDRVMEFVDHFKEISLFGVDTPKIVLNDDIAISIGSKFKALEFGIDRCTYVFLYITDLFCRDSWSEYSSETCLMEAIHNPDKKWCVVPVFTEPKRRASFRIPPSLNSLKGIQYWTNDKFFRDSVQKLLEEKLYIRKKNERQLTRERKEWVTKYRIKKYEDEVQEQKENLARQKRENDARRAREHKMAEMERLEREEQLQHDLELNRLKSQSQSDMQSMLQQFAQKFNVASNLKSTEARSEESFIPPGVTPHDFMQWLRQRSGQSSEHLQSVGSHPDSNTQATSSMRRSASDHIGLSSRASRDRCGLRGLQETSVDPPRGDEGSTGFSVLPGNRKNTGSAGVAKFFSLPNRPVHGEGDTSQAKSLPPEASIDDLEEDFKSIGPGSLNPDYSYQDSGRGGHTPSQRPGGRDEVHYHYHYYGDPEDKKSSSAEKKEPAPVNIVGATVVQIGNDNTVKLLGGQVVSGAEELAVDSEEEDEDPPTHSKEPGGGPALSAVSGSQPPSTIYQDNNPSVVPHHSRQVQLPSRTPEPAGTGISQAPAAAAPSQHVAARNVDVQPRTQPIAPVSRNVPRVAPHLPPNPSTAGAPPVTSSGPVGAGFGDIPSVQRHSSSSLSALQAQPSAPVRPVGVAALISRGVDGRRDGGRGDCAQENIAAVREPAVTALQNVGTPPQEHLEMATESVETLPSEDEDPITAQTLAKQRALESEVD